MVDQTLRYLYKFVRYIYVYYSCAAAHLFALFR